MRSMNDPRVNIRSESGFELNSLALNPWCFNPYPVSIRNPSLIGSDWMDLNLRIWSQTSEAEEFDVLPNENTQYTFPR